MRTVDDAIDVSCNVVQTGGDFVGSRTPSILSSLQPGRVLMFETKFSRTTYVAIKRFFLILP